MNKIRFIVVLGFILVFVMCSPKGKYLTTDQELNSFRKLRIRSLKYKRATGTFLYEEQIPNYRVFDAIIKPGGVIKEDQSLHSSYYKCYYIINIPILKAIHERNSDLLIDSFSLNQFLSFQMTRAYDSSLRPYRVNINCNSYVRIYMDFEYVTIGDIYQILPEFDSCKEHKGEPPRGYLSSAIVTKIYSFVPIGR